MVGAKLSLTKALLVLKYCACHIRESVEYKRKHQHVVDYEYQRYQRLMRNNSSLSDGFTEEWNLLNGGSKKCIFCDFTLKWGYGITGDGMLSAIQKDCVRNREPHSVKMDEHLIPDIIYRQKASGTAERRLLGEHSAFCPFCPHRPRESKWNQ